ARRKLANRRAPRAAFNYAPGRQQPLYEIGPIIDGLPSLGFLAWGRSTPTLRGYRGREAATICRHVVSSPTPRIRGSRTEDERQSAQFRPVGDHRSAAACAVHAVPEPRPAHDVARHFLLAVAH